MIFSRNSLQVMLMLELIGILVGLIIINAFVSLLMVDLVYRCYRLLKDEKFDLRELLEE